MIRIGLALGSGGARGLAHVGVLSVLEREGLLPHCIAGTSMGAIVGALYAETGDAAEVAARLWRYTEDPQFKRSWAPFIDGDDLAAPHGFVHELRRNIQRRLLTLKTFTSPAHQKAEALLEPLEALFETERIEALRLPFAAVAIDLVSGAPRVFTDGSIVRAVYASSAIPAVFPPLEDGDALLSDGGGPYRVPVKVSRELGADFVLAVDIPSFQPDVEVYRTGIEVVMRSDAIARHRLNRMVLREADFTIRPEVADVHWADFAAADRIRQAGEAAMTAALPDLRLKLKEQNRLSRRFRRRLRGLLRSA